MRAVGGRCTFVRIESRACRRTRRMPAVRARRCERARCAQAGRRLPASRPHRLRPRVVDALRGPPDRRAAQAGLAAECGCGKL
ncbi:hypothetical protein C7S16_1710 [Burkholderia thailandensis]|uniref:Uncharacterized protein n=1 Tax=Burkholderia thailandensis TaxID=57975 RepID=A0AAW9CZF1_BURTH|nr:hypothetical protein [Burkholderia thailandensis]